PVRGTGRASARGKTGVAPSARAYEPDLKTRIPHTDNPRVSSHAMAGCAKHVKGLPDVGRSPGCARRLRRRRDLPATAAHPGRRLAHAARLDRRDHAGAAAVGRPFAARPPRRCPPGRLGAGTAALVATWPEGTLRIDTSKGWERDQSIELVFRCEARPATPPTAEQVESFRRRLTAAGESPELARHDLRLQLAQRRTVASGGS